MMTISALKLWRLVLISSVAALLGACASPKTYVDPGYARATYSDIKRSMNPLRLRVVIVWQRNGESFPKPEEFVRAHVERVLRGTGWAEPVEQGGDGELRLTINNIADRSAAAAKGFGTGLTFGLVGSMVTDYYEMSMEVNAKGKELRKLGYKHALHTTIGNAEGPPGLKAHIPAEGVLKMVEELVLNAIKDLQQSGELTLLVPQRMFLPAGASTWLANFSTYVNALLRI